MARPRELPFIYGLRAHLHTKVFISFPVLPPLSSVGGHPLHGTFLLVKSAAAPWHPAPWRLVKEVLGCTSFSQQPNHRVYLRPVRAVEHGAIRL